MKKIFFCTVLIGIYSLFAYAVKDESNRNVFSLIELGKLKELSQYSSQYDWNQKNRSGETPLIRAVAAAQIEIVDFLIEKKVNLNVRDQQGGTALLYAVSMQNLLLTKKLIAAGAELNLLYGEQKENILFEVSRVGGNNLADEILRKSPQLLSSKNKDGEGVLWVAIKNYQSELALHLIKKYKPVLSLQEAHGQSLLALAEKLKIKNKSLIQALKNKE